MSLRSDVKEIKERSNKMYDLFSSYLGEAIITERKLKSAEEKLKFVEDLKSFLKVSKIEKKLDENGNPYLNVEYDVPSLKLKFDDKGILEKNACFIAINMLDLICYEDMQKLSQALMELKK